MPETPTSTTSTPEQLTARLTALIDGPYTDQDTADTADLTAETIRYLNYAAAKGGITNPATITHTNASLATAIYRLPQLLNTISQWLTAETQAGRIADDHHRPPAQLTDTARTAITQATDHAANLATALNTAANLTATLHTTNPPA